MAPSRPQNLDVAQVIWTYYDIYDIFMIYYVYDLKVS